MRLLFVFVFLSSFAFGQNVDIPDANFKKYLIEKKEINTNGDNEIQLIEAKSFKGNINCGLREIKDLTGIESFTSLIELSCYENHLSSLDLSKNRALKVLHCNWNGLTTIDVSKNTELTELNFEGNDLISLDVSKNISLTWLNCFNNYRLPCVTGVSDNCKLLGADKCDPEAPEPAKAPEPRMETQED